MWILKGYRHASAFKVSKNEVDKARKNPNSKPCIIKYLYPPWFEHLSADNYCLYPSPNHDELHLRRSQNELKKLQTSYDSL